MPRDKGPKERSEKKAHKKEHKRKKKHKKKSRRDSGSSSSGTGNSDGEHVGSALSQLERDRAAVQASRFLLHSQPGVRKDFRELLWMLDNGKAVGLDAIPDDLLRSQLIHTLDLLGLKHTKGKFWLPSGAPATLSVVGFVFDEVLSRQPQPPTGFPQRQHTAPVATVQQQQVHHQQQQHIKQQQQQEQQQQEQQQQQVCKSPGRRHWEAEQAAVQVQLGPEMPEDLTLAGGGAAAAAATTEDGLTAAAGGDRGGAGDAGAPEAAPAAKKQRVMGPAAPSAELLAAAAAYHSERQAAGGYDDVDDAADGGPDIGPPPPDMVLEVDAEPADAREAQVLRVLKALREAAAEAGPAPGAAGPAAPSAAPAPDPYAVLDVESSADAATIRKAYWRLSLLVHPDKCCHPAAQEVFQTISKAAQLLQDTQQRQRVDAEAEEAALRKAALAAAAAAERQVAWKVSRGEAVPAELAATLAAAQAAGAGPARREAWMTDLPSQQQRTAASALASGLSQASQTSFSRFGTRQRGDTSGWTDTPEQARLRAAGLLPAAESAALALPSAGSAAEGPPVSAALKVAMAEYSQRHRQKSLLEQHAEQQHAPAKKEKTRHKEKHGDKDKDKEKEKGQHKPEDWVGKHPWKPFDREKDMEVQVQRPKGAADLLKAAGALSSRFSTGK